MVQIRGTFLSLKRQGDKRQVAPPRQAKHREFATAVKNQRCKASTVIFAKKAVYILAPKCLTLAKFDQKALIRSSRDG